MSSRPATVGQLRESGWVSRSVKHEVRENAVARISAGQPLFERVLGYEDTVLPQLENALLAGHDVIFLGERGQAKTRMIRSLTGLLDEWMPIVAGSEINDDPYVPSSRHARDLVAEHGEDTPIIWVHRDHRYGEKLATPDTSIADLIGEVDPIKVAEGRYLSDELTLHYGLVPRTNRGIFAINELPDLAERIQVGLLNVLEERDVQIRGYQIRLPLDVLLVASANPEDYTNRGRIITPLKDRFGSQIRTHYPLDAATELAIIHQEVGSLSVGDVDVQRAEYLAEVVATFSQLARASSHVNQRSGVSVRLSVTNYEAIAANALRRGLRAGERQVVARVDDLDAIAASAGGKIELEVLDDGREGRDLRAPGGLGGAHRLQGAGRPGAHHGHRRRLRGRGGGPHRRGRSLGRPRGAGGPDARPAHARGGTDRRRRVPAGRGGCGRLRAGRSPLVEAAQQGRPRRPRHLPRSGLIDIDIEGTISIGLLAIGVGALFCFGGYIAMRVVIADLGRRSPGSRSAPGSAPPSTTTAFLGSVLSWGFGLVFAVVVGLLAYLFYELAVAVALGGAGFVLATGLAAALGIGWTWLLVLIGSAAGILLAVVALAAGLPAILLVVVASFAGATTMVGGLLLLVGTIDLDGLGGATTDQLDLSPWWHVLEVVLGVGGILAPESKSRQPEQVGGCLAELRRSRAVLTMR